MAELTTTWKKRKLLCVATLTGALRLAGASGLARSQPPDTSPARSENRIVAVVNGSPISIGEVQARARPNIQSAPSYLESTIFDATLERVVEEELLRQESGRLLEASTGRATHESPTELGRRVLRDELSTPSAPTDVEYAGYFREWATGRPIPRLEVAEVAISRASDDRARQAVGNIRLRSNAGGDLCELAHAYAELGLGCSPASETLYWPLVSHAVYGLLSGETSAVVETRGHLVVVKVVTTRVSFGQFLRARTLQSREAAAAAADRQWLYDLRVASNTRFIGTREPQTVLKGCQRW